MRRVIALWPMRPREMAASAGPKTIPAAWAIACETATAQKFASQGSRTDDRRD
jgi:hypothetical protein